MADYKITADSFKPAHIAKEQQEKLGTDNMTFMQDAMRRLRHNKMAMISLWIIIAFIVISLLSFFFSPSNPNTQHLKWNNLPPKIANWSIPGFRGYGVSAGAKVNVYAQNNVPNNVWFVLGTDSLGRDIFSRILVGTRVSLFIAFMATLFDLTIGVVYGLVSGWKGGMVDTVLQRIIEIISSIPNLVVAILMLLVFKPGLTSIIIAIGFTGWVTMARLVRAQTLQIKDQEYVLAARTLGESSVKIAMKHLIPNLSSTIIIQTMFTIPTAIFFEAFLSYIGIGIPSPTASLGTLLSDGQKNFRFLPYQMVYPAIVISVLMISFNLLADGLRDAFDPRTTR
ncbi:ABC transporter permease [Lacticaseibacillus pantheris]|jgi:oligopeptide transport system permease protein|uniref:Oligopeptide ABC transporter permease n=1 Tax=Lacticaseibacillus pantheris DSM 15945 = JCM 12539 = NBRC 106106 TaxID=1423783 RepID=A0A0R1U4E5_9LACO|nr:ABC transporter permease [Lacticaseibacillus pantheris]KRL88119.1 oligopeptide ABC transporter permease [Lacticaseibacillus pantheris DSM 15945 = JCM 12539 = NBRC 106106]WKF84120.1 ABC transporter permease [Lacticaseibacillus pantheris]